MNPHVQAQVFAAEVYRWGCGAADDLLARLFRSPNRTTQRLYAADLRHFRNWLARRGYGPAETFPLTLAIFLGYGPDRAQQIAEDYRDHLLAAGKTAATCNRHLVTIRAVVRIAQQIGRIPWTITVPNVRDNVLCAKGEPHDRAA